MDVDLTQNFMKLWNEPGGRVAFALYCAACLLGQILNAGWLWLNKKIPCVMSRFSEDPRATAVALITNLSAIVGVAILIPFEALPLQAAIMMGLTQGFSSDSALNRNPEVQRVREVWTEEQRAAAKGDPDATNPGS